MTRFGQLAIIAAIVPAPLAVVNAQVAGAVRTGARAAVVVPRVTIPVRATTAVTAQTASRGTATLSNSSTTAIRSTVALETRALLMGITWTSEQRARAEAAAQEYVEGLEASAQSRSEETVSASRNQTHAARERGDEARDRYRARLRAMLAAEQQATFDANVRAAADAEARGDGVRAEGSAETSASVQAGGGARSARKEASASPAKEPRRR